MENQVMSMAVVPMEVWQEVKKNLEDVKELLTEQKKDELTNEWVPCAEAQKMLGVSGKTWQKYRDERIIPFSQIGRKIYVKRKDILEYLEKHYISNNV